MSLKPTVLLLAGSPSEPSRSAALLDAVAQRLSAHQGPAQAAFQVERLSIRDLYAPALVLADWSHPQIVAALAQVARAQVIVVATPVYKAAYSGLLKVFLDLLPQTALASKTVLPLATGGSPHHMLALDYALRPVLQSLSARHILPGVYATDVQIPKGEDKAYSVSPDIAQRLDEAVSNLLTEGLRMPTTARFEPVLFSTVRCSV
ncbi:MAG: NADPH-dependent FMN reductase [Polaromonas sp.]